MLKTLTFFTEINGLSKQGQKEAEMKCPSNLFNIFGNAKLA